jgi:hypothetical protein
MSSRIRPSGRRLLTSGLSPEGVEGRSWGMPSFRARGRPGGRLLGMGNR